jgi:hypothetical protein
MRSIGRKAAITAAIVLVLSGCNVTDADIEHWKHTQRGPGKITTVLVEGRYDQSMRVHAARALIEMKHPNANGLELLQGAFSRMAASEREPIIHALVPELQSMLTPQGAASAQGPTEQQVKAKDAAYVILRGEGRVSFAGAEDRTALTNLVLDWVLGDFNSRALAGSYTAEQLVQAIGPSSTERLTAAIRLEQNAIPVVVEVSKLINGVAAPAGKQVAVARVVSVAREVEGPPGEPRLREIATTLLTAARRPTDAASVTRAVEQLRTQYLTVLFEAIRTLGQPNGTDYLLSVASNAAAPLDRRKMALTAMAGTVTTAHTQRLLAIATCGQAAAAPDPAAHHGHDPPPPAAPAAPCDIDLRGLAVDRVGETRDRAVLPQLFGLFDTANGGAADQGFMYRWKLGEAVIKLGGASVLPEFMQHLGTPRPAPFAGFTFAEINGEAQAIGDLAPPPRAVMRGYLTPNNATPVRVLAMMFLGVRGEQQDLATLQTYATDATPVTGVGWDEAALQLTTVGAVARRTRNTLEQTLRQGQGGAAGATAR